MRSNAFVIWCSFTGHWDVARRYDAGSRCWSICCIQEHCPVPVHTLSRYGNGARPYLFQVATCDVTGTMGLHQGHALTQSLSDSLKHLEAFPDYKQSVPELWATVCGSITFVPADRCVGLYNMVCSALLLRRELHTVYCTYTMHSRKSSFVITPPF